MFEGGRFHSGSCFTPKIFSFSTHRYSGKSHCNMKRGPNDAWRRRDSFSSRKSPAYPEFVPEPSQVSQIDELDTQSVNQCFRGYILKVGDIKEIVVKSSGLSGAQKTRHVISFVMQDESASITVTVWGDLVTKYEQLIQVGNAVFVKNALPKEKSKWDSGSSSLCDLHLQSDQSSIEMVQGEEHELLTVVATGGPSGVAGNLVVSSISDFETGAPDSGNLYNLLGVVAAVSQPTDILTKDGKETQKSSITVFDMSQRAIEVSFWGSDTKCVPNNLIPNDSIVLLTNVRVREFKGTVSATFSYQSLLYTHPKALFSAHLSLWLSKNRSKLSCLNWSQMMIRKNSGPDDWTKSTIADAIINTSDSRAAFVSVTACVTHVGPELQSMFKHVCSTCGKDCKTNTALSCVDSACKSHQRRSFHPQLSCSPFLSLCDHSGSIDRVNVPADQFLSLLGLDNVQQLKDLPVDDYRLLVLSKLVWRRLHVAMRTRRDFHGNVSGFASAVSFPESFEADIAWLKAQSK